MEILEALLAGAANSGGSATSGGSCFDTTGSCFDTAHADKKTEINIKSNDRKKLEIDSKGDEKPAPTCNARNRSNWEAQLEKQTARSSWK